MCAEGGVSGGRGGGCSGGGMDGVNTPAYKDWANIQFVPSRLSSTVAATQFLPIDLSATGTITPREATSPEYGAASSGGLTLAGAGPERRWVLNQPRDGNEMN